MIMCFEDVKIQMTPKMEDVLKGSYSQFIFMAIQNVYHLNRQRLENINLIKHFYIYNIIRMYFFLKTI